MTSPKSLLRRTLLTGSVSIASLAALLVVICIYAQFYPVTANAVKIYPNGSTEAFDMPLMELSKESGRLRVSFDLLVPSRWSPRTFMRYYRNHTPIDTLTINNVGVAFAKDQFTLDLSSVLHQGWNHVDLTMHVQDDVPSFVFGLEPSRLTLLPWLFFFACAAIILLWHWFIVRILFPQGMTRVLGMLLLGGVLLRVAYAFSMPYYMHAHDVFGHIAYIQHVAANWTIPLSLTSWQAHQAPLYYFLTAPLFAIGDRIGLALPLALLFVQQLSVLLSIGVLLIGFAVVRKIFASDYVRSLLATLVLCTFPALIFQASQINNDVLLTFLGFVWFFWLLRAIRSGQLLDWCITGLIIGMGMLTKGNAILWIPVTALLGVVMISHSWKRRIQAVMLSTVVAGMVVSPLLGWRHFADPNYGLVANAPFLDTKVLLSPTLHELTVFNPMQVLRRRAVPQDLPQNFPEALFLTSQFGYADFGPEASILLVFGIFLMPVVVLGALRMIRRGDPVHVLTVATLVFGLLLFRLQSPYPSSQNFRYIAVAALPITILIVEGTRFLHFRLYRAFAEMLVALYGFSAALLIFGIVMA